MIELYHIKAFLAIVQSGSYSSAGRELYITQSSVSRQIQELEKELGFALFERDGRSIRLTPAGRRFVPYAMQSLSLLDDALSQMKKLETAEGTVRVALLSSFCTYTLPRWLPLFQQQYPDIEIKITTDHTRPIIDQVLKGKIDLGIVRGPINQSGVNAAPLYEDKIRPVIPSYHPWAKRSIIPLAELKGENLISFNRFSKMWSMLEDWLRNHHVNVNIVMDLDHIETSKQMVWKGLGITFLPWSSVQAEIRAGKLSTFSTDPPVPFTSQLDLIYNRRNALPSQVRALIDFCINMAENEKRQKGGPHVAQS